MEMNTSTLLFTPSSTSSGGGTSSSIGLEYQSLIESLPVQLQQRLEERRQKIVQEVEAFKELKQRELENFQNELFRTHARDQQRKQQRAASSAAKSKANLQAIKLKSSLKSGGGEGGNNNNNRIKRVRNVGDKKRVTFALGKDLPPVSPRDDVEVIEAQPEAVKTESDYFRLPTRLSNLHVTGNGGVVEQADGHANDDSPRNEAPHTPDDVVMTTVPAHDEHPSATITYGGPIFTTPAPASLNSWNQRSFSTTIPKENLDLDSDDVFALDETLHATSFHETPITFKRSPLQRVSSFTDSFNSSANSFQRLPVSRYKFQHHDDDDHDDDDGLVPVESKWMGNQATFHGPTQSNVLAVPVKQGSDSNASSFENDVAGDTGGSNFGSSLPIEIEIQPSSLRRSSFASRSIYDDTTEMGLSGSVLGEDEESQLEKIKNFENPRRLSFSDRIIWEEHVGSVVDR
ncbi:hypothetical protein V1514DRAFT_368852 [Lipomyces japonicus]|uniref:uncharacterized protein n=1 Tax=Lipomyces japonicus TaxID=56871 RepID=UPI0034D00783